MPRLHDRERIRSILETERPWTVYALADLEPGLFEHAHWFCSANKQRALALLFSGFAKPVLITIGTAAALESVMDEIIEELDPCAIYAAVKPEVMPLLSERYRVVEERKMQRMVLDPKQYRHMAKGSAVQLSAAQLRLTDLEAIQRLYADGEGNGESPDWFLPQMLEQGTYYGIREGEDLVAVAGTHVVSLNEKLACLGNIYTRRDRRGRGKVGADGTGDHRAQRANKQRESDPCLRRHRFSQILRLHRGASGQRPVTCHGACQ